MPQVQHLVVYHTNDIHSRFAQMPKIACAMRELRRGLADEEVLMLEIGDHMDRMHPITEGTGGRANVAAMNRCGYEAALPGNNEGLTFTREEMRSAYRDAKFAVIGSNMYDADAQAIPEWMQETMIMRKGGLRVGLIGVTVAFTTFYELLGWDIRDPLATVRALASRLRPEVDLLIVMSHLGLRMDQRMAEEVPGIDVILGGHTHHLLEQPLRIGTALVCAAGHLGRHLGEVRIAFDPQSRAIVTSDARVIEVEPYADDSQLAAEIAAYGMESDEVLSAELARLGRSLPNDSRRESPLGNLLAIALRKRTDAELSLVNAGQLLDGLPAGPVRAKDLLRICPSPINPCSYRLSGAKLRQALEESLLEAFVDKPIKGFGFRGEVLGTLCLDGMQVTYDPHARPYGKIIEVRVQGELLDEEREYRVGTIDMFTFGSGYASLSEGRDIQYRLPEFIRDVLGRELADEESLFACRKARWLPLS